MSVDITVTVSNAGRYTIDSDDWLQFQLQQSRRCVAAGQYRWPGGHDPTSRWWPHATTAGDPPGRPDLATSLVGGCESITGGKLIGRDRPISSTGIRRRRFARGLGLLLGLRSDSEASPRDSTSGDRSQNTLETG